jgi:hypothetical protein
MIDSITPILLKNTQSTKILDIQLIQHLWSNYGELNRVILDNGQVIVKLIKFPKKNTHPKGWNSDIGHLRKKKSYEIEANWYQSYNDTISEAIIPNHLASGVYQEYQYLILEDLKVQEYTPRSSVNWEEVKLCLSWLANFHKNFLGQKPNGLWQVGTYWHLDTRPEELKAMKDSELKNAAPLIDEKLNRAKYQTFVHGDAKLANFLFNKTSAAAVDFQYVGGGIGVKDLAYFLSSIYNEDQLIEKESECLEYYFKALNDAQVEKEWRELYPFALCDFYRFLLGWSPGHWKINSYTQKIKKKVLQCL